MEKRYQIRWNSNMLADYCSMLKRDVTSEDRPPSKRSFNPHQIELEAVKLAKNNYDKHF